MEDKPTLSHALLSLSQLSKHISQLADTQFIPVPLLVDHASLVRFRNDEDVQAAVHQYQTYIHQINMAQAMLGRAVGALERHINLVHNAKAAG